MNVLNMTPEQMATQMNVVLLSMEFERPTPESRAEALQSVKTSFEKARSSGEIDYTWEEQLKNIEQSWLKSGVTADRAVLVLYLTEYFPVNSQEADAMLTEMPSAPEWTLQALACIGDPDAFYNYIRQKAAEAHGQAVARQALSTNTIQ